MMIVVQRVALLWRGEECEDASSDDASKPEGADGILDLDLVDLVDLAEY